MRAVVVPEQGERDAHQGGHATARDSYQKNPRVHKISARNSGAGMLRQFYGRLAFLALSAGKPPCP